MNKIENRKLWKERIEAQLTSGLTQKKWCEENKQPLTTFRYWKLRFNKETARIEAQQEEEKASFAGIVIAPEFSGDKAEQENTRSIKLHINQTVVVVPPGFSEHHLTTIIRALRKVLAMLSGLTSRNVHIATGATDLRKSIDGLSLIVRDVLKEDPFSMHLFAFCNKRKKLIKILVWDQTGFWIHYKRLENSSFQWPDKSEASAIIVTERSFLWLLDGLKLNEKQAHPPVCQRIII